MGKVSNDEPLVHRLLAFDTDTGAAAEGAIRVVRVGAVDAEFDSVRGRVDGGIAVRQGAGKVLITGGRDGCLVESKLIQRGGIVNLLKEYSLYEALRRIRNRHEVEAIYQSLSGVRNRQRVRHSGRRSYEVGTIEEKK